MNMPWNPSNDPRAVTVSDMVLSDGAGGKISLVCRHPATGPVKGVVVFCHGLGSSGKAYGSMTDTWAAAGYLVIHPTFADSIFAVARAKPELGLDPDDPELVLWARKLPAVRPTMFHILHDPAYWLDRIRIVRRIMDEMPSILAAMGATETQLPVAIAGHSFGAYTAQLFAGAVIDLPDGPQSFRDERFRAAMVLSGQGRNQQGLREGSWDGMTGPVLTVTGKEDGGAKGQDWHWKCEPYDLAPPGGKYLAVLDDANHYLGGMTPEGHTVPYQLEALALVTTAFLDAHVSELTDARDWLDRIDDRVADCPVIFRHK